MAKFEFEEYRQPWETGPHWELKREFLEHYQDNFPEDRLLCLAQAYSNITLLHCSYPAPVMIQIHELSKPLKGCKMFRGDLNSSEKNNTTHQKRQGKRSSDSGDTKKFKFIKFCSGESKLLSGENPIERSSTDFLNADDSHRVESCNTDDSPPVENCNADDSPPVENRNADNSCPVNIYKAADNCNPEDSYPVTNCNAEYDSCPEVDLNIDYASIFESKDFKIINLLASQVQKFVMVKKKIAMDIIQSSATLLKINNLIKFKFSNRTTKSSDAKLKKNICELFVSSTRIAAAEGTSTEKAKKKAAESALQILMNFEYVPSKNLNDLQNTNPNINLKQSESDLLFLHEFAKHLKSNMKTNQTALSVINMTGIQMKVSDSLVFNISEDLSSPSHNRNFCCSFSVKNISISQAKASGKKRAKQEAAESGIKYLLNLLELKNDCALNSKNTDEENNIIVDKMVDLKKEDLNISKLKQEKINPKSPICTISKEDCSIISNSIDLPLSEEKKSELHFKQSSCEESKEKSHSFVLNNRLLDNSFQRQLVLFDKSEIYGAPQSYAAIIGQSFQQCRKNLTYDLIQITNIEYKANLLLDKEIIASGTGATGKLAKLDAAKSAVEILRKNVYTIKVKNDLEESLVISRVQMSNLDTENSRAISEGNVGHKMLKMMGWSGGGIGKSEGRVELISNHRTFVFDQSEKCSLWKKTTRRKVYYCHRHSTKFVDLSTSWH